MDVRSFADAPLAAADRPPPPVRLHLADGLLTGTQGALRDGSDGIRESTVLWAGQPLDGGAIFVSHLVLPTFIGSYDFLTIPLEERIAVAGFLRSAGLLAVADLHTHPAEAFLSEPDRARPFSQRDGFYAIVIPDFAAGEPGTGWRCYEARNADWHEVEMKERVDAWPI
jgi:hypothetical protein